MTNSHGGRGVFWPVLLVIGCSQPPPPPLQVEPQPRTGVAIKCSPPGAPATSAPNKASTAQENAVTLDGVPPLPDHLRRRMNQYLNTRSVEFSDWAIKGTGMLIQTRFGETVQVHRVAKPLGQREQLTFFPEPVKDASFVPRGQDRSLLLYLDTGGAENYQLAQLSLSNGRSTLLTDGHSRTGSYLWSKQGQLAYSSNARNGRDMDIYLRRSLGDKEPQLVQEVQGDWTPLDFSPDEKRLLLLEYISLNETYVHQLDLATSTLTPLTPRDEGKAARLAAVWSKDGRGVFLTSDHQGEFVQLYYLDLATKKHTLLSQRIPWNVEELELSPDRQTLTFITNEEGYSRLYLLDTRTRKYRKLPLPDGLIWGVKFSRRRPALLGFTMMTPAAPAEAYSYDVRTGKLERWTRSEVGGLDLAQFVAPTLVRYPTFDEHLGQRRTIPAFYYRPRQGSGPWPVVISIHGGPEAQFRPYFSPQLQLWLLELGVAVIAPNVRGSDGYGKSYLLLDNGRKREGSVRDIGALLDWIKEQPELDPQRVLVYGGSYGGYMVLASLVHFGQRLRGGVDWVGISNFVTFLENTKDYRRDLRRAEYGDERDSAMRQFLHGISPLTQAAKIVSPLLVIQGANDPRVPASESEQLVKAVRESGQTVWYMLARNEGHGFRKKSNRDLAQLLTTLFLETFLK